VGSLTRRCSKGLLALLCLLAPALARAGTLSAGTPPLSYPAPAPTSVVGSTITTDVTTIPQADWYTVAVSTDWSQQSASTDGVTFMIDMTSGTWEYDMEFYGASASTTQVRIYFVPNATAQIDSGNNYYSVGNNGVNGLWAQNLNYCYLIDNDASQRYRLSTADPHGWHITWTCKGDKFNRFSCRGGGSAYDITNALDRVIDESNCTWYRSNTQNIAGVRFMVSNMALSPTFKPKITLRRRNRP
jgi:hypothetical protein